MDPQVLSILLFVTICAVLLLGFPVAWTLGGISILFACIGILTGCFEPEFLNAVPSRVYGTLTNTTLLAVPLFVFMGCMLEKARTAENLLSAVTKATAKYPAMLGITVILVGALLAASTGIVGATVITMGLIALPSLLKNGYSESYSTGVISATGTLGQIVPPSIALILLGDVISTSYQQAQLELGNFAPESVSVGDLFAGAIVPSMVLVLLYCLYSIVHFKFNAPTKNQKSELSQSGEVNYLELFKAVVAPLLLIVFVLGSILFGFATPTEAAGVGAFGAILLAILQHELTLPNLKAALDSTVNITAMVFLILIAASIFSLVFRGFGGEDLVHSLFACIPGGVFGAVFTVMVIVFLLGFILDFIEITFVVVPLVAPALFLLGVDPIWLGIMLAINLQTSFLTPPFGFALFYLRGVAPKEIATNQIYKGVIPFIALQILLMGILALFPDLVTWLPNKIYG